MNIVKQRILQYCRINHSEVVAMRRYIHMNPELAFRENNTADFICRKLDEYGIPYQRNIAKTGVDYISIGTALTNAGNSLDISLEID